MTISELFSFTGPVATFVALAVVVLGAFRTNTARVWKDEAEAQRSRADRLQSDMNEIKERLTRIEAENQRLIELLTALDPDRIRMLRI